MKRMAKEPVSEEPVPKALRGLKTKEEACFGHISLLDFRCKHHTDQQVGAAVFRLLTRMPYFWSLIKGFIWTNTAANIMATCQWVNQSGITDFEDGFGRPQYAEVFVLCYSRERHRKRTEMRSIIYVIREHGYVARNWLDQLCSTETKNIMNGGYTNHMQVSMRAIKLEWQTAKSTFIWSTMVTYVPVWTESPKWKNLVMPRVTRHVPGDNRTLVVRWTHINNRYPILEYIIRCCTNNFVMRDHRFWGIHIKCESWPGEWKNPARLCHYANELCTAHCADHYYSYEDDDGMMVDTFIKRMIRKGDTRKFLV